MSIAMDIPQTKELYSSHIPALHLLMNMGYQYLRPDEAMKSRGNSTNDVILRDVLIEYLKSRRFTYKGQSYPLSPNAIDQIVRELASPSLNEGLLTASEQLYDRITLGITVTEFIEGKKHHPTIQIIDWNNLENNVFHITDEFDVLNAHGTGLRRPDIVCFINGLPLVVIEAKRPDAHNPNKDMLAEGISQQIRNQKVDEIPHLFAYSQLLLSVDGKDGKYATTKTPMKFWAKWREEEFDESRFDSIKNRKLSNESVSRLLDNREPWVKDYFVSLWQAPLASTDQDRLLVSLLKPERLIEFIRFYILYDRRFGKIAARYQQAFGVKKMLERVNSHDTAGARNGGVIWHTTGSGKSFSMVYLCKSLILHDTLKECRIVVVTDRIDLEKQLSKTFMSAGAFGSEIATRKEGERAKAKSGKDLAKRIGQGKERIIFTIIDKFNTASKYPECHNDSPNMIVLVDEGHRGHGGETHQRMRQALPKAAYIAFTGTPLLKDQKTENKFGPIIHAYTMQRAAEDGTVTPLLYEERIPELNLNEKAIDNWFEKITHGLSDSQRGDLKKKFSKKGAIYKSANRIELIAWDISTHFSENLKKLDLGLKGQIATDSRQSAIRYKKYLDEIGLVSSAIVMSPPDSREGHEDVDESQLPEVQEWWKNNVGNRKEEDYTKEVIEAFGADEGPDILIVVWKLLTGFDEPRNTVLYIDKPLKEHDLIQAIARVNRLHEHKQYGLLIDYRGILKELDTAIKKYQDLAKRTQGGFDVADIEGMYRQVNTEYKKLPRLNDKLWEIFQSVQNKQDLEQYRQILIPKYAEDENGDSYDTRQKVREDFYEALTEYGLCLQTALSTSGFYEDGSFSEEDINKYKSDLRFFTNLRLIAKQDAQETVDYSVYDDQIRKLVDKQVIGEGIKEPKGVYLVNELGKEDPDSWSEEKTRNETDIIRTRIKKSIEQDLADDPYAQMVFSELLKKAIEEAESLFDHPFKQYALFKDFEEQVQNRDIKEIPDSFGDNYAARAYFGIFKITLGDETLSEKPENDWTDLAISIDEVVDTAIAENSLNPQNIEAQIRKNLLPLLFKLVGMDKAKEIIEHIIQITRIGLARSNGASQ